jgi:hypothetical protein
MCDYYMVYSIIAEKILSLISDKINNFYKKNTRFL